MTPIFAFLLAISPAAAQPVTMNAAPGLAPPAESSALTVPTAAEQDRLLVHPILRRTADELRGWAAPDTILAAGLSNVLLVERDGEPHNAACIRVDMANAFGSPIGIWTLYVEWEPMADIASRAVADADGSLCLGATWHELPGFPPLN